MSSGRRLPPRRSTIRLPIERHCRTLFAYSNPGDATDIDALIDGNYVDHQGLGGTELTGVEGFRQVAAARAAMPNLKVIIENSVIKGDCIVARLRWRSMIAAAQIFERETLDVLRIRGGRLAEHWGAPVEAAPQHYRANDWIDPRIEIRSSPIHGRGMFAKTRIGAGEVVTIWGGEFVLTESHLGRKHAWGEYGCTLGTIGEGRYLGHILDEGEEDLTNLINHSCDPNVWMHDEVTVATRRDIGSSEELTLDYAMIEDHLDYAMIEDHLDYAMIEDHEEWIGPFECRCGSPFCRGRFTGKDWHREDLQARYDGHFSPFINERIRRLRDRDGDD